MLYLDAAATAPLHEAARDAMLKVLRAGPANASSVHTPGQHAKTVLNHARQQLATAIGARESEVVFTSGGTEANNLVLKGVSIANPRGKHIVTTAIEHSSVGKTCQFLAELAGFEVTEVEVDQYGRVNEPEVIAAINNDTTIVSIGLANGEVGTVQSINRIGQAAKAAGAIMHTDAVQAAASLPVSFGPDAWPGQYVDAMSIASHKFGGPQGAGALLIRDNIPFEPLLHGGGQENSRRSGTENLAAIAGFSAAVATILPTAGTRAQTMVAQRETFITGVLEEIPGAKLTGHRSERLPNHASFVFERTSGESILIDLDVMGVAASSGSACSAGKKEPSSILLAMGFDPDVATTALRFTFPDPLTDNDYNHLLDQTLAVLKRHGPKRLLE